MAGRAKLLISVVVIVVLSVGCRTYETTYTGNPAGIKVGVLGDSITYLSTNAIHTALDPNYQVQIDATSGARLDGTFGPASDPIPLSDIDTLVAAAPDVVVINLGTNQDSGDIVAQYTALVARFPNACIVGVTVNDHPDPAKFQLDPAKSQALNAALPNLTDVVVDWNAVLDPYVNGGVHPNAEGSAVLANLYAEAIPACDVDEGTVTTTIAA